MDKNAKTFVTGHRGMQANVEYRAEFLDQNLMTEANLVHARTWPACSA